MATQLTAVRPQAFHHAVARTGKDLLSRLPAAVLDYILSFILPKRKDPFSKTLRESFQFEERIYSTLEHAHDLTRRLCLVISTSRLSKGIHSLLQRTRDALESTITTQMTALQDGNQGVQCVETCVTSAFYPKVLKVFFRNKPEALLNHADNPALNVSRRTVLHATLLKDALCPPNFINFILGLDGKHNLGLMTRRDCTGKKLEKEGWLSRLCCCRKKGKVSEDYNETLVPFLPQWKQALANKTQA